MVQLILRGKRRARQLAAIVTVWAGASGFDAADRSINGTGETLKNGTYELGLGSLAYGVRDDWLVRLPTLSLLVGAARAEVRTRFKPAERWRVSPYVGVETPRYGVAGIDAGWDLGTERQHSLTAGAGLRYGPIPWPLVKRPKYWQDETRPRASFEYDYYHRGNAFYAGVFDAIGYVGYTWAWPCFHIGMIASPRSSFIPFPYLFWRI